jgi:3-hydroxyisobutyrate dehydrogenase-like beta-hydroxyacid dehydrogenase
MKLGFIGVGNVGGPVCRNLMKKGYGVIVHDLNPHAVERCTSLGASKAESPKEVASQSNVVFSSLPLPADVEMVALGKNGIVEGAHEGLMYVDLSTNLPAFAQKLATELAKYGIAMLDAPVIRGLVEVEGTMTSVLVGGDAETFEKVEPLLQSMAKNIFHVGGHGAGCTVKLVNNYLEYCNLAVAKEGLMLGVKGGINPELLLQVLQASNGDSPFLHHITRAVGSGNYRAEYAMDLSMFKSTNTGLTGKSLKMALQLGEALDVPLLFGSLLINLMRQPKGPGTGGVS